MSHNVTTGLLLTKLNVTAITAKNDFLMYTINGYIFICDKLININGIKSMLPLR